MKYIVEQDNILVKEYLEVVGLSRKLRRKVRVQDIIYINGEKAKNYYPLHIGDVLELDFHEELNDEICESDYKLNIKYEDDHIIIISKDRGISSQPSRKHQTDNIVSAVKSYFLEKGITTNVHLVNRLDFNTSGLMIIAKDGVTHFEFSKVKIKKQYLCLIEGHIEPKEGLIDKPIDRYPAPSILRYVSETGKPSRTYYKVLEEFENQDLILATLGTGRTHQIRVHFKSVGHPLVGDALYGKDDSFLHLHCCCIEFIHPWTHENIKIIDYPDWVTGGKNVRFSNAPSFRKSSI